MNISDGHLKNGLRYFHVSEGIEKPLKSGVIGIEQWGARKFVKGQISCISILVKRKTKLLSCKCKELYKLKFKETEDLTEMQKPTLRLH